MRLKENSLYLVTDERGQLNGGETGLYLGDTRLLSRLEWRIAGQALTVLSTHSPEPFRFTQHASEPGLGHAQRLGVLRQGWLSGAQYQETLYLRAFDDLKATSHGPHKPDISSLELRLEADFVDIFEVRGLPPLAREVHVEITERGFVYSYSGQDGVERQLEVLVQPMGEVTEELLDEPSLSAPQTIHLESAPIAMPAPRRVNCLRWSLSANAPLEISLKVTPHQGDAAVARKQSLESLQEEYAVWRAQSRIQLGNPVYARVFHRSSEDLRALLFDTPQGPFPAAGIPWFCTPFGRDSLIVALMTLPWYPQIAHGTLRYLAAHQGQRSDAKTLEAPGKILHEQRSGEASRSGRTPFQTYYGSVDATPLWVCLLAEYLEWSQDVDTVRALEPNLRAALEWMRSTDADPDGDGFIEYSPHAGGITNQVWKDSSDSVFDEYGRDLVAPIAVVEVQAYAYRALTGAAQIYSVLGDSTGASACAQRAETLRQRFEQSFWLEELGTLAHALDAQKRPARALVSNPGHALWAGIVSEAQAGRLAETLLSTQFWSGWGIRTLAEGQPRYNPVSYHNGSVWPHDNALIALGLARYGLFDHVKTLVGAQLEAAALAVDARLPELFTGFKRQPDQGFAPSPPVPYPAACHPQAWDAAAPYGFLWAALGFTSQGRGAARGIPAAWGEVQALVRLGGQWLEMS